ncbi:DUF736 family protein [Mesorhizobium sp. M8A.F.Ca.ET.208.01.1.1]|uniref:DUF736 domain-containing protein n=1 Tax=unclassified Mesorhizobium TaxID=325217 RepID=UPI001093AF2F|nr:MULTISPECIES: DUF736 family protein [unclassified Mesorhizobium]TGQ89038.1 DUF736 family protein [Mesorhizobium sp. M8A.F.Ca.ET.208.01.1.1]TGR32143.1 DUF736 family protein [Mesorhizobium sp. M8A.F.Ca.ET.202.01.1.1]TGT50357.1 DUF736 family protein [Mesorhizobium sp. M8A.F.Ca.ET.167.01.1.1]TGU40020.1 DUF736 family protein [bacterium M00.F.Ca.ET.156.01.1.1]
MAEIGVFQETESGYSGRIRTLLVDAELVLVPTSASDGKAPDFRIHIGDGSGPEVGAAWKETGQTAGDYLSCRLEDPLFGRRFRASLFRSDDGSWSLRWMRPKSRPERAR